MPLETTNANTQKVASTVPIIVGKRFLSNIVVAPMAQSKLAFNMIGFSATDQITAFVREFLVFRHFYVFGMDLQVRLINEG